MIMKVYNLSCVLAASSSAYGMIGYLYFYGLKFGGNPQGTSDTAEGKVGLALTPTLARTSARG